MLHAEYRPLTLKFKETAITSRSAMQEKESYLITLTDDRHNGRRGEGEAAIFRGLSAEDTPDYEALLSDTCKRINELPTDKEGRPDLRRLTPVSSVRFGFETAIANLYGGSDLIPSDTPFAKGESKIHINGLIWMGDKRIMAKRIAEKLDRGFRCVKLKIGGIAFNDELDLIAGMRKEFSPDELELRVDANGAFTAENALERLKRLSDYTLHSIEQPVKAGQWDLMAQLCATTPLPIALDEELIGMRSDAEKAQMLKHIQPQYIILKPSLCGGFREADSWIREAEANGIGWWATSALESNIGLEAIARWVSKYPIGKMPQGLGTGALYEWNFPTRLVQEKDYLISK